MDLLTRTLLLLLTCEWVASVENSAAAYVTRSTWCYAEFRTKSIRCPSDSTLFVVRALVGVTSQPSSTFCGFPEPSQADCVLGQEAKTDFYRKKCNTFSVCSFMLYKAPPNTCGSSHTGVVYLSLEYLCQPIEDSAAAHLPIVDNCPVLGSTTAPAVTLSSLNYPREVVTVTACTFIVSSPTGSDVNVVIQDLAHETADNLACPYYVDYGGTERMCARRGLAYMTVNVRSGSTIQIVANGSQPLGRYSIQVSADPTVTVMIRQETQADPTFVPATWPTPTVRSTTTPTSVATPTTGVPDAARDTRSSSSHPLDGANAGSTTRGPLVTTTSHDVTTVVSSISQIGMGTGFKIIIGGALAGTILVVLIITCVGVCVGRRQKPRRPGDLGYMVHANMAIRDKLKATVGSLRNPPRPTSGLQSGFPPATNNYVNLADATAKPVTAIASDNKQRISKIDPNVRHVVLRRSDHCQSHHDNKDQNRKSRNSRKSVSQTMSTANVDQGSSEWLAGPPGVPYAVSGVFACFPRWTDNPRGSDAPSRYDLLTATLPAKLNKKPMPLPKPRRSPSETSMVSPYAARPISPPGAWTGSSDAWTGSPGTGTGRLQRPASSISIDNPGFGTASSTDALYAVPNKMRRKKPANNAWHHRD